MAICTKCLKVFGSVVFFVAIDMVNIQLAKMFWYKPARFTGRFHHVAVRRRSSFSSSGLYSSLFLMPTLCFYVIFFMSDFASKFRSAFAGPIFF